MPRNGSLHASTDDRVAQGAEAADWADDVKLIVHDPDGKDELAYLGDTRRGRRVDVSPPLALVLALVRLLRGPSLPDRIVALDLMTTVGVAMCGIYAVTHDQPVFLDVAVVMALITFVGTVAFARYLEERQKR